MQMRCWQSGRVKPGRMSGRKMMIDKWKHLPGVGQRITRSVCAVFLCFVVYYLRGQKGIPFYSALAALQCIQPYMESSTKMAKQRISGTLIGAAWGLAVLLLLMVPGYDLQGTMINYALISLVTGAVLYSAALLGYKNASYFSSVVFLSITVNHMADDNPYLFVFNRVVDTLIGVAMAILMNSIHLPRIKKDDVLFISGVDDTLLTKTSKLTPFSKIELNRLIDGGAKFTLSTHRTPATLMESVEGIHLKLPVIVMDGAAIYDIREHAYLMTCAIPGEQSRTIAGLLKKNNLNYFANVIIDDLLVIYYETLANEAEQDLVKRLRRSPYRNYVNRRLPENEAVVYFMSLAGKTQIDAAYQQFCSQGLDREYKIVVYDSEEYSGYSYMKIYHRDAERENMKEELLKSLQLEKCITFGSVAGKCDILIDDSDKNTMVKLLKREYEPVGFRRKV